MLAESLPSSNLSQFMNNTYGALLIGTLVTTFVSGTNAFQAVLYFRLYPEDSNKLKLLVAAVLALDLAHTGLMWTNLWFLFVENFGDPYQIDMIQKPFIVPGAIIVGMVLAVIVHMCYLRRVFDLSHGNYWISVPILLLIISYIGNAIESTVILYRYRLLSEFSASRDAWVLSVGLSCAAATDIAITACLFVLLRSNRKRSISLNSVIDQIILYTLEMRSLTSFMAIAVVITWFVLKQNSLAFLALYLSLAKAYAFSFLGSLNTRYQLRRSQNYQGSHGLNMVRPENVACQHQSERTDISSTSSQKLVLKKRQPSPDLRPHDIHVDVTREIWNDDV